MKTMMVDQWMEYTTLSNKKQKTYVRLSSYMGFVNYGNECA